MAEFGEAQPGTQGIAHVKGLGCEQGEGNDEAYEGNCGVVWGWAVVILRLGLRHEEIVD